MAKKNPALALVVEIASKLEELKVLVGGTAAPAEAAAVEETPSVELPSAEDLADNTKTPKEEIIKLGKELNIELPKVSEIRAALVLASRFAADDKLTPEETAKLAGCLGLEVSKKQATNAKSIAEYLSAGDSAAAPDAAEETAAENDDDAPAVASDDDDAPAVASDDDEKVETVDDDDAPAAATDDDAAVEGPSDDDLKAAIGDYNKFSKTKLKPKDIEGMRALLTDDKDVVHQMGEGYTKDGAAWACGFPLQDLKDKAGNDLDYSKCRVTGKYFKYDGDEELVEYVKPAKK